VGTVTFKTGSVRGAERKSSGPVESGAGAEPPPRPTGTSVTPSGPNAKPGGGAAGVSELVDDGTPVPVELIPVWIWPTSCETWSGVRLVVVVSVPPFGTVPTG
jgi:hypothetical protein